MFGYSANYQGNKNCISARWHSIQTKQCVEMCYLTKPQHEFKINREGDVK